MIGFKKTEQEEKIFPQFSFVKRMLLFVLAYAVYAGASLLQLYSGDFIPQESSQLDGITAYDYIMPIINSLVVAVSLAAFFFAGYYSYAKDKIRMLRYPMAFSISCIVSSFCSFLFTALLSTPAIGFESMDIDFVQIQNVGAALANIVTAFLMFLYFDREKDDEYCYYTDYYVENPSAYRSLRSKILSWRFSIFCVILIVAGTEALVARLARSGFTTIIMNVPDDYLWVSYYIEVAADIVSYSVCILLAAYFARNIRLTAKLVGIICLAESCVNSLSFINNSISNVFSQAGDHWLNSVLSTIFVGASSSVIAVVRFALIVFICYRLEKIQQD